MAPLANDRGQSLVEAVLGLPLLLTLLFTFFTFVYEQLWSQIIEHLLHETLICEKTLGEKLCLETANYQANRYNLFGTVFIRRQSATEIKADMFVLRKLKWKTLVIKELSTSTKN